MSSNAGDRYKLVFFAPTDSVPKIKTAIFAAGAGRYPGPGNYTEACWFVEGTAQFRPGATANPAIGTRELEEVKETRFETICVGDDIARKAVAALKEAHPYEEVAYEVYKMQDF